MRTTERHGLSLGCGIAAFALTALFGSAALAAPVCPPRPLRWQEDCSSLAGKDLKGADRLRYIPIGEGWLSLGGEARVRAESVESSDFSIASGPQFVQIGRRAMGSADYHFNNRWRVFGQIASAQEDGREPGPRAQDSDLLDLTQLFLDVPADIGAATITARIGRQELELSENRLVTTRDGANMRRTFQGVKVDASYSGMRLSVFRMNPTLLQHGVFDDKPNSEETFTGISADLPRWRGGAPNLYLLDKTRQDGRSLETHAPERRYTAGGRYTYRKGPWDNYAQVARQWGKAQDGYQIKTFAAFAGTSYQFDGANAPRLVGTVAYASGDKRFGDGETNMFDPVYPNNFGLSDAPFLYQSNYFIAASQAYARFGGTEYGAGLFYVSRASTADAVYGQGRPIAGTVTDEPETAFMLQASARRRLSDYVEFYGSVVHARISDALQDAGGRDATYVRLDINARF